MASYDRRILIPYLRDICCTEMLCKKLEKDIATFQKEANKYTKWADDKYTDPKKPNIDDYPTEDYSVPMIIGVVIGMVGVMLLLFIPILGVPAIGYGLIMMGVCKLEESDNKEAKKKEYENALIRYKKICAENQRCRDSKEKWRASAQKWRNEEITARKNLQEAKAMRNKLYSVNIIPSRYRTIHAVYYLYEFFDTGRETDLEKVIQTMLLDEIIQRLDKIILQNEEIMLNQRMQIALQEEQNRAMADQHRQTMEAIARMEHNQELQIDYQNMIARNQEVTNFFLAADYLRKNR